ncbi:MAG: GerMN domain-containing protein [Lachnospiraceae bacterium]|nr:GerMN domain-containing protein [Lachnospiraceae bacterium]
MKKRTWMVLLTVITMAALAACSNAAGEDATVETVVVPETSSEELLVDSLKYLLEEEETEEDGVENETVAGNTVQEKTEQPDTAEEENIEENITEESVPGVKATIYYGNGASTALNTEEVFMEQITAENLLSALVRHNIVSLDTKVNSLEETEEDGRKKLQLDLSGAFREYLKTMTPEGEKIIIASVVDTFLEAYDADEIILLVDGEALKTSHASYESPISFGSVEQMKEEGTVTEE